MTVTSDHIWYPAGGDSPAYDLRKVKTWHEKPGDPSKVLVRMSAQEDPEFYDDIIPPVEFDKAAFETAKQVSDDAEPSGGGPDSFNGLYYWYDLSDASSVNIVGSDREVTDKSGVWGDPASDTNAQMDYGVHTINGLNTISDELGSNTNLSYPGSSPPASDTSRRIMYVVAQRLDDTSPAGGSHIPRRGSSHSIFQQGNINRIRLADNTTFIYGKLEGPYVITVEISNNGLDSTWYVDDVLATTFTGTSTRWPSNGGELITIDSLGPSVALGEMFEYSTDTGLDWTVGDQEHDDIISYLVDKWGLALTGS